MTRQIGRKTAVVMLVAMALGVVAAPAMASSPAEDITLLARWMTGSFSSAAQAKADTAYYDIRLEMAPIPSNDGQRWIYVEQATAASLGSKPYRQRVYRLEVSDDGTLFSHVYTLPGDPLVFAGAYDDPARLATLPLEELTLLEGCSLELYRGGDRFQGATVDGACGNSWGEASYATSEVTVTRSALRSWDRGYNDAGEQVWGATDGPYVFDKTADRPVPAGW